MTTDFYDLWEKQAAPREAGTITPLDPARATRYAAKALQSECENVAAATEGTRNDTLNRAAFNLGQLVAAGHLVYDDVEDALLEAGRACGLGAHETNTTVESGLIAGAESPRVVPDLPPAPGVTVLDPHAVDQLADGRDPAAPLIAPILDWRQLWTEDHTQEWVLEPLLPARRMVALYSPPKAGKSLLMLELAAAIATGREALGYTPEPRRVLYIDFENDPAGDILTRLIEMGYTPEDLYDEDDETNLRYLSYPSLAKFDTPTGAADLLRHIHHYEAEVVVIDTLSRAVMGEENSNDTWLNFYRHTGLALKQAQVSCIRLDHTGKDHSKGMRGGSAKYGDVDAVWSLTLDEDTEVVSLECTDKRLPIAETRIDLRREREPLRHTVATDVWRDKVQAVIDALDDIEYPADGSNKGAIAALKAAGRGRNVKNVRAAQAERNRRPHVLL